MAKGHIFKIKSRATLARKWVSILPSGAVQLFETWDEAAEFQGAPLAADG